MTDESMMRLVAVEIDASLGEGHSAEAQQERQAAIQDLLFSNTFTLSNGEPGPYHLIIGTNLGKLVFDVRSTAQQPIIAFGLSLTPFRRIVTEYLQICESYYDAIRNANPAQIETIDMARRGLHNTGSDLLRERLAGKVDMDQDTSRRLFTLVCALWGRAT